MTIGHWMIVAAVAVWLSSGFIIIGVLAIYDEGYNKGFNHGCKYMTSLDK